MMTKKEQRRILVDIRKQVKEIARAIKEGDDQDFLEQLGMQLSATALNFEMAEDLDRDDIVWEKE